MKLIVIGIAGKAKVGKTTLAHALYDHVTHVAHEHNVCAVLSLADPLKDECAAATDLPREWFDDATYKEFLRPLMQWWGTEFRRNEALGGDNLYWVKKAQERIVQWFDEALKLPESHNTKSLVVVIPDIRFDNEVDMVHEFDVFPLGDGKGIIINLLGDGAQETPHTTHASEAGINPAKIDFEYTTYHSIGTVDLVRIADNLYESRILPFISK